MRGINSKNSVIGKRRLIDAASCRQGELNEYDGNRKATYYA